MTEGRPVLSLKRPISQDRLPVYLVATKPNNERLLLSSNASNRYLNGAISQLCLLAHQLEADKATRRSHFDTLYLADRLYGSRQDRRPKLGKYLHIRHLLIDRWWHKEHVRKAVLKRDRAILEAEKQNPGMPGF